MRTAVADVLIIGGGAIGLATAWRARQRGMSVTLLDRGDLGAAASAVAAGMLAPVSEADAGERDLLQLGLRSARTWRAFAEELQDVTGVDVGYRATGSLVVARDRDDAEALERELGLRTRLGLRAEKLLPSQARRLEPALAPAVRTAMHAPDDHSADPVALTAALAEAARRAGATLRPGVDVTGVAPGTATLATGETLRARTVVVAAGAWSGALVDGLPVRPVKGQVVRMRGDHLLDHVVRFDGGYLVPRADGRVVLGATMEERGFDASVTVLGVHDLLRDAAETVPGVLELQFDGAVAGFRPGTPDNAPLLGTLTDGLVVATGHHRNGVLLAPVSAELVAAELAGEGEDHPFSPHRFQGVPA